MNKNQKLAHLLAGLGDFVSIGMPEEVTDGKGMNSSFSLQKWVSLFSANTIRLGKWIVPIYQGVSLAS